MFLRGLPQFSLLWTVAKIKTSLKISIPSILNLFFLSDTKFNASTTVLPETKIFFLIPFFKRFSDASWVGEKCKLASWEIILLFASSGNGEKILSVLKPASTWPIGIFLKNADSAPAKAVVVSPCTKTRSGIFLSK